MSPLYDHYRKKAMKKIPPYRLNVECNMRARIRQTRKRTFVEI